MKFFAAFILTFFAPTIGGAVDSHHGDWVYAELMKTSGKTKVGGLKWLRQVKVEAETVTALTPEQKNGDRATYFRTELQRGFEKFGAKMLPVVLKHAVCSEFEIAFEFLHYFRVEGTHQLLKRWIFSHSGSAPRLFNYLDHELWEATYLRYGSLILDETADGVENYHLTPKYEHYRPFIPQLVEILAGPARAQGLEAEVFFEGFIHSLLAAPIRNRNFKMATLLYEIQDSLLASAGKSEFDFGLLIPGLKKLMAILQAAPILPWSNSVVAESQHQIAQIIVVHREWNQLRGTALSEMLAALQQTEDLLLRAAAGKALKALLPTMVDDAVDGIWAHPEKSTAGWGACLLALVKASGEFNGADVDSAQ